MLDNQEQDQPVVTLPVDFDSKEIKLCRIDDPDCEACQ